MSFLLIIFQNVCDFIRLNINLMFLVFFQFLNHLLKIY